MFDFFCVSMIKRLNLERLLQISKTIFLNGYEDYMFVQTHAKA